MMLVRGINTNMFEIYVAALNNAKLKEDEDFLMSADTRRALRSLTEDGNEHGKREVKDGMVTVVYNLKQNPSDLLIENAPLRYLERVFKDARKTGEIYRASGDEQVLLAMKALKDATEVKAEELAPQNGNRVEKALKE